MKRKVSLFLAAILALTAAGCGEKKQQAKKGFELAEVTTTDAYPQNSDQKLTYWVTLHTLVSQSYKSLNETPFAQALREQTGIDVEFVHPTQGQEMEQFNLMIAGGTMCDIVEYGWTQYPGGITKAVDDGIVYPLNDLIDKVSPNLKKYLAENEQINKELKTLDGDIMMYPLVRGDERLCTFQGFMVRDDLMKKAGITEDPETIDEFEELLRALKANGVRLPLSMQNGYLHTAMMGAFGIMNGFYVEDGKVKYGFMEEEKVKAYVQRLANWYKEGLLDPNFYDKDGKAMNADVTSGDVGVVFGSCGGNFGLWIPTLKETVPGAELRPIKYLSEKKGEKAKFGQYGNLYGGWGSAITTACENPELAARFLDYGYSEAGHNLYNFGIEGESYIIKDGIPTYTELVTDPSKNGGVSIGEGISKYARASYYGPFIHDYNYITQYYSLPQQKKALELWSDTDTAKYFMPNISLTAEETKKQTKIMKDVTTVQDEYITKYINGSYDASNMDAFFSELKDIGIEEAIEIEQAAYDRYLKN